MQVFLEAINLRIADVGAVEEGSEVEEAEPWNEFEIEFPEEFAILSREYVVSVE